MMTYRTESKRDNEEDCSNLQEQLAVQKIIIAELTSKLLLANIELESRESPPLKTARQFSPSLKTSDTRNELRTTKADLDKSNTIISSLQKELIKLKGEIDVKEFIDRMVKHELRSSLIASVALPELLLEDANLTETQITLIELIQKSGSKMLEIVDSSMILYRIEEGTYNTAPIEVNLFEVLSLVAERLEKTLSNSNNEMEINCMDTGDQDDRVFMVYGDPFLLFSIFMNIISNASEASPPGQPISVTLSRNKYCTVAIRNYGIVPKDIRSTFFEKLVTSGKEFGTGLGTYAAMSMTKAQGGDIELDCSESGVTTIYVRLPKPPAQQESRL